MHQAMSRLARGGVLVLAIAVVPAVLPASAQTTDNSNGTNGSSMTSNQNGMVPGTGLTMAELRDLGYSHQQISEIRTGAMQQANTGSESGNAPVTSNAETGPNMPSNNGANAANANQPNNAGTNGGGGGGGWGLWGLVGLLGLLGLRRGSRTETVRTDRDRDIRRVA